MIKNLLTAKTKNKLQFMHFKTYRSIKTVAHRVKSFFYDPNDSAPGDDFPNGPLVFSLPKSK